jgi:ParB-like chromosome segregation protein Spo0J
MGEHPYQLLPPLSAEEYAALKADIAANGIRVPVDVDEAGQLLDGHHRAAIAAELGIDYPTRVVAGLTEEAKADYALAVNLTRRQLSQAQKRALIAAEIERRPDDSDRAIARRIGCDHKTVGAVRREQGGEIPHPDREPQLSYAEAEALTEKLRTGITRQDEAIIFALSNQVDPDWIVARLTTALRQAERKHAGDEKPLRFIREYVGSRIDFVLDFDAGVGGRDE